MPPIKVDDKLVNLDQATFINLDYREDPDNPRNAARIVFGPGKFLILYGTTAEKFRKLPELQGWSGSAIAVDDLRINPDQIAHADLKFRSSVLVPPGVREAVHIVFSAGNELNLLGEQAVKFREGFKRLGTTPSPAANPGLGGGAGRD